MRDKEIRVPMTAREKEMAAMVAEDHGRSIANLVRWLIDREYFVAALEDIRRRHEQEQGPEPPNWAG